MTARFSARQWVPFPVELVFAFFANPANLPHLMPPGMKARIESVDFQAPPPRPQASQETRRYRSVAAGVGSEILISFLPIAWVPRRLGWSARITEFEWNSHFCDEQVAGPFAVFRHRHGIVEELQDGAEGTQVSDEIEFELPFGWAGRTAVPFAQWQMGRLFAYRQKRLPEVLAAAQAQAIRRG
jgi:ligand-binding SRPBCC domain-containing protein